MLERNLEQAGVAPHAARVLAAAARRSEGCVVICGPAGVGKTCLANLLARHVGAAFVGELRMRDDVLAALRAAEHALVVAVARSGESDGLSRRWLDMGIPQMLIDLAAVTTVTLRRLPRAHVADSVSSDVLIVEVLGPDGGLLTRRLADEAEALVSADVISVDAARFHVPGYE